MAHFRFSFDRAWGHERPLNATNGEGREPNPVSRSGAQPTSRGTAGFVAVLASVAAVSTSCASEAPLTPETGPRDEASSTEDERGEVSEEPGGETPAPVGQDVEAPGMPVKDYPAAPYGTEQGSTIANLELFGWRNPVAANFDVSEGETVRLSDFYNPDGATGGTEYIMLNAVAAWCGVCRAEYQEIETAGTYRELSARGLEMVGVLFEDNNGEPSTFQDMTNWARAYSVSFPFVNDPAFVTGVFFDKSATPMNMLVDARTMKIVLVMTGYNPMIYDQIDRLLTERGR